jgi:hypothetical protein
MICPCASTQSFVTGATLQAADESASAARIVNGTSRDFRMIFEDAPCFRAKLQDLGKNPNGHPPLQSDLSPIRPQTLSGIRESNLLQYVTAAEAFAHCRTDRLHNENPGDLK